MVRESRQACSEGLFVIIVRHVVDHLVVVASFAIREITRCDSTQAIREFVDGRCVAFF